MKNGMLKHCIWFIGGIFALFFIWGITYFAVDNPLLVPSVKDCVLAFFKLIGQKFFWQSLAHTLLRVGVAFLFSLIFALGLSIIAYASEPIRSFLTPIVTFLRSLPVLAVLLILWIWTSSGVAPIVVAVMSLFPILYNSILTTLLQTDKTLLEMSDVYQVPLKKRIVMLYLPIGFGYICKECVAGLTFALKLVISAEVLTSAFLSLGSMMQEANTPEDIAVRFALVAGTFFLSMMIEVLGKCLEDSIERRYF